jgi:hypothetical protein
VDGPERCRESVTEQAETGATRSARDAGTDEANIPRDKDETMKRKTTFRYQLTYTINGHERQTWSYAPTLRLAKRELLEALPDAVVLRVDVWSVS